MILEFYQQLLGINNIPYFLKKYLKCSSLLRLKNISYFCGMDYASKDIYDFKEIVTRYDHSLNVALITYRFTKNKKATIAGLFHDVATPCFSHVIDYMNGDYANQESTEEYTERILKNDKYLLKCLKKDKINLNDIVDFKKYTIVDNKRPKLCADRFDGLILTGAFWNRNVSIDDVYHFVSSLSLFQNEYKEMELGFNDYNVAQTSLVVSEEIDVFCHSKEDNFMMELLAKMTKYAIDNSYLEYDNLYIYNECDVFSIFDNITDDIFIKYYDDFKNIKVSSIEDIPMPYIKKRDLNPIANGKRIK